MGSNKHDFFILDMGTCYTRIGYGGDYRPKHTLPTAIGSVSSHMQEEHIHSKALIGESILAPRADLEIQDIYAHGNFRDFDTYERFVSTLVSAEELQLEQTTIIVTEGSGSGRKDREKMCELFFDKLGYQGVLFSKVPVLNTFAAGRTTSVVLDCGDSLTTATVVHDGFTFGKTSKRSEAAGNALTNQIRNYVENKLGLKNTVPQGSSTKSFHDYHQRRLFRQIKEQVFNRIQSRPNQTTREYILPDKTSIRINRKEIPDIFFNTRTNTHPKYEPLQEMVKSAIDESELEIKQKLYDNVLIVGGSSLMEGFAESVKAEMQKTVGEEAKVRTTPLERRKDSAWVGASILSSVSSLPLFCISKAEYKEHGITILDKKCP